MPVRVAAAGIWAEIPLGSASSGFLMESRMAELGPSRAGRADLFLDVLEAAAGLRGRLALLLLRWRLELYERKWNMGAISRLLVHAAPRDARWILGRMGASLPDDAYVETHLFIHNARGDFSNLSIGHGTYVGTDCLLDLSEKIVLGDKVTLAMRCTLLTHIDGGASFMSVHQKVFRAPITIEQDAYIGCGSIVLPGTSIGRGAIVGAGSVVTQDVAPFTVVAGTPARLIKAIDPVLPDPACAK
jgi:acetyltransferase-like isoleucine patch superfamily enzyme